MARYIHQITMSLTKEEKEQLEKEMLEYMNKNKKIISRSEFIRIKAFGETKE